MNRFLFIHLPRLQRSVTLDGIHEWVCVCVCCATTKGISLHCLDGSLLFCGEFCYEIFGILVRLFFRSSQFAAVVCRVYRVVSFSFFCCATSRGCVSWNRVYEIRIVYIWQKRVRNDAWEESELSDKNAWFVCLCWRERVYVHFTLGVCMCVCITASSKVRVFVPFVERMPLKSHSQRFSWAPVFYMHW